MVKILTTSQTIFILTTGLTSLLSAQAGYGSDDLAGYTFPVQAITRLQPKLTGDRARRLAKSFETVARTCGIDWRLLVSIAFHESSLTVGKINHTTHDYGLMQLNEKNILRYGLSYDKILRDPVYSLEFACMILKDNQARYGSKYPYWLGLYRSGTRLSSQAIRLNAQSYDRMIRKTARAIGYQSFQFVRVSQ